MKKNSLSKFVFLGILVIMVTGISIAIGMSVGNQKEDRLQENEQQKEEVESALQTEEQQEEQQEGQQEEQFPEAVNETPFDMANPVPDETYTAIVSYQAKKVLQSENGLAKAEITVTMPQLVMRSVTAEKINEQLFDFYRNEYENGIATGEEDAGLQQESSEDMGEDIYYDYTYEVGYEVTLLNDKYLSILADGYEYAGGAHGMPFRTTMIFDLETGEQVKGKSLFEVSEEQFREIKLEAYRELIAQSEEGMYWENALSIVEESANFDSDYYLTENGVTFYYHPYALAPYAAGYVEATVPYEKLPLVKG